MLLSRLEGRCSDTRLSIFTVVVMLVLSRQGDLSVSPWTHYFASMTQIMKK
jgi:hypothetical protein